MLWFKITSAAVLAAALSIWAVMSLGPAWGLGALALLALVARLALWGRRR